MPVTRRRLGNNANNEHSHFQPGNQLARGNGRPLGSRNRTTNLMVEGIRQAICYYGKNYIKEKRLAPNVDLLSEAELFGGFMIYLAKQDIRAFASIIKGLIPRGVSISLDAHASVEVLPPQQLRTVLEQRGLRLPPQYQLTAGHGNDDDNVSDADIARALERPQ